MTKSIKQVIDEICEDCCHTHCEYCTAKQILLWVVGQDPRHFIQIKCIEKFKYEKSEELKRDIGWDDAAQEWTERYAEAFAKHYDPDLSYLTVYRRVMQKNGS